jgi:hypothetical protein
MADPVQLQKALSAGLESFVEKTLPGVREALLEELAAAAQAAVCGASSTELSSAFYRIAGARTQTEIMQGLLDASAPFACRAAVLVIKGERLAGWRSRGLDGGAAARLRETELPPEGSSGWKQALSGQSSGTPVTDAAPDALAAVFFQPLGAPADNKAYLLPLIVKERPVALLYADAGESGNPVDLPAVDLLATITGMCLELSAMRGQRPAAAAATAAAEAPAPPPAEVEAEPQPVAAPPPAPEPEAAAAAPPAPAAPARPPAAGPDLTGIPEADHDSHRKAFRAAKVMVDELILYNKGKIEEAQAQRNIYGALQDDIDKCRATYQKRFQRTPGGRADYFHQQLVQRIALGDAALLGADYPGPLV